LFLLAGVSVFFNLPYSRLAAALSGFLVGALYFYLAFWLYSEFAIPLVNRIVAGLVFSLNIVACMFCFLNWPPWQLYGIISYVALGLLLVICLSNYKKTAYKPLFYRCISFIAFFSLVYIYKRFTA